MSKSFLFATLIISANLGAMNNPQSKESLIQYVKSAFDREDSYSSSETHKVWLGFLQIHNDWFVLLRDELTQEKFTHSEDIETYIAQKVSELQRCLQGLKDSQRTSKDATEQRINSAHQIQAIHRIFAYQKAQALLALAPLENKR